MRMIKQGLNNAIQLIVKEARKNLVQQGHVMTGELKNSVGGMVKSEADGLVAEISFLKYGLAQDTGIKAGKIPYSRGSGASRSKYIQGLIKFVKMKIESNEKKAKGIAFAIAQTHKRKGMHTKNGNPAPQKQGWFSKAVESQQSAIEDVVQAAIFANFETLFNTAIDEANRNAA